MDRASTVAALMLVSVGLQACPARPTPPATRPGRHCRPVCRSDATCQRLPDKLVRARGRFLKCVGQEAQRGHVDAAHRCYRALRLLESARWWARTLMTPDYQLKVYQPPEVTRDDFLCCIERLIQARTPDEVERLYLEMVRNYP